VIGAIARAGFAALIATLVATTGCSVNEYCVNCAKDDGGVIDGGTTKDADQDAIVDGTPSDACVPDGVEICDGHDNDCDGQTDENTAAEPLPQVGAACGKNVGECTTGTYSCTAGALVCSGHPATAEICDNKDNNCDGNIDDGDPGGGAICGTDVGECVSGVNRCQAGVVTCVGAIGSVGGQPELCNGKDDDCDGSFDEGLPSLGSCGLTDTGECALGQLMCVGGQSVCVGAINPTFELCDNLDQDCDGNPTNGYDLVNDARNCGTCGHVCTVLHGTAKCSSSTCSVGACDPGFYDLDTNHTDCEYACDFQGPIEACNGVDDNCNGQIDEGLTVPDICDHDGACAGTVATCGGPTGWTCNYGPNVSKDASGNIIPETTCDGIDNDCDGVIDDSFPTKGQACDDGGIGVCRGTGTNVCNAAGTGVTCNITTPGQTSGPETCNGKDDNCNGTVDEGAETGNLAGQNWVDIGNGRQVMAFEASRPGADAASQGTAAAKPCSKAGVLPWTSVTAPQAQAACATIGARLCSEEEWQSACAVVARTTYPAVEPAAGNGDIFIEAEQALSQTSATSGTTVRAWQPDFTAGFSGMMGLRALPDTGAAVSLANSPTQAPRLDFQINFTSTGNHTVWVRMYSAVMVDGNGNPITNTQDTINIGVNGALPGTATQTLTTTVNGTWHWVKAGTQFNIPAIGNRYLSVWMREDGVRVDAIFVTRSTSNTPPTPTSGPGGTWAYDTSPNTYAANTCNGVDYDTNSGLAGNQDDIIACGALASCDANWSATQKVYDMSGNVKEWTAPRLAGVNPIRGGASNNLGDGLTCGLSFTAADNNFFFSNVGFRCCR
jgi:formylglycine-generating enzyme required for sulfatase activity